MENANNLRIPLTPGTPIEKLKKMKCGGVL